jgi:uncharacterized Zn finger protein (UPF0148 family)
MREENKNKSEDTCPACGWPLEESDMGTVCVNPDCEVTDNADDFDSSGNRKEE